MSADKVSVSGLADAVMEGLLEYAELATEDMKAAVKKAGQTVRKEIQAGAPVKTGAYKKSWAVKTTRETSPETGISWRICWSLVMRSGAADVCPEGRTLPRLRRRASGSWKKR